MDELHAQLQRVAGLMMRDALGEACSSYGVEVLADGGTAHADRVVSLPEGRTIVLTHDEREAPFCVEGDDTLVSITDEDELALCVWAVPRPGSDVVGIGVDLASICDFAGARGERFNHLLFSEHEQDFVRRHYGEEPARGYAYAFSAKEAAFKSLAAPLRAWYVAHEEELAFEVREFELADAMHERGTLRHACAQAAMDAMGIRTIELSHVELADIAAVLTLAVARV